MALGNLKFPDKFKKNPREGELQVWQGPRIIPSSFKSIEGFMFQNLSQVIFDVDYFGWHGSLAGTGIPPFDNFIYDTFKNESKVLTTGWNMADNKATAGDIDYWIDIYADSISDEDDFEINNCKISKDVENNIWRLWCHTGTTEVQKAQIMKTLFYGTDGSNPRASATYITSITEIKTPESDDVGKRAYLEGGTSSNATNDTGTFASTSGNEKVNSWSYCGVSAYDSNQARWEMPSGTTLNFAANPNPLESDETGTNTSADNLDNPASCQLDMVDVGSYKTIRVIILTKESISWSAPAWITISTDFLTDNSIPVFTQANQSDVSSINLYSTKSTFSQIVNGAFFVANFDEDTVGTTRFDVSADDGENWTENIVPNTFFMFRKPGKILQVRIRYTGSGAAESTVYEYSVVASDFDTGE